MQRENKIISRNQQGTYVPARAPLRAPEDVMEPPRARISVHEPPRGERVEPGLTDFQKQLMSLGLTFLVGKDAQISERKQLAQEAVRRCKEQLAILKRDLDNLASRIYRATAEFQRLQKEYTERLDIADQQQEDTEWIDMHYALRFQDLKDIQDRLQVEWERLKGEENAAAHALALAQQEPALSEVNSIVSDYRDGMKLLGDHDVVKEIMENRRFEKKQEQTARLTKRTPPLQRPNPQKMDKSVQEVMLRCKQNRKSLPPPPKGPDEGAGGESGELDENRLIHTTPDQDAQIL